MKTWHERIRFGAPLKGVQLKPPGPGGSSDSSWLQKEREQAAFERGRQEGEKALSEQLMRQRRELLELQQGVLDSLRRAIPQVIRETESVLVNLAAEVAFKLVGELPITSEMIQANIREALNQVEGTTDFEVLLHPEDLEMLQRTHAPILLPTGDTEKVRFGTAPNISRGGCLVHTRFGVIDARRETKIELIEQALRP
jgi:flagellar assembly protein FliH